MRQLLNLFYPELCHGCGSSLVKGERSICIRCIDLLPRTNFHPDRENMVEKVFWGKVELSGATSFAYFNKGGTIQRLLHELKYRGARKLGTRLGELLGEELAETAPFKNIDLVVPVPLHRKKERKRGFNQAELIALGVCGVLGRPLETKAVMRNQNTATQTKRSRFDRWDNVGNVFSVSKDRLRGKRVLVIDDVITTGATIGSCANAILQAPDTKVCIATIATA